MTAPHGVELAPAAGGWRLAVAAAAAAVEAGAAAVAKVGGWPAVAGLAVYFGVRAYRIRRREREPTPPGGVGVLGAAAVVTWGRQAGQHAQSTTAPGPADA